MALPEDVSELRANLDDYQEQLQQVLTAPPARAYTLSRCGGCLMRGALSAQSSLALGQSLPAGVQLEELLLDEPENQDYQELYQDVQEVRASAARGRVPFWCLRHHPALMEALLRAARTLRCRNARCRAAGYCADDRGVARARAAGLRGGCEHIRRARGRRRRGQKAQVALRHDGRGGRGRAADTGAESDPERKGALRTRGARAHGLGHRLPMHGARQLGALGGGAGGGRHGGRKLHGDMGRRRRRNCHRPQDRLPPARHSGANPA